MTKPVYRHDLPFSCPSRTLTMRALAQYSREIPVKDWTAMLATSSLTMTAKDRTKILKIDSTNVYTMDIRRPDGTYKSTRFPCQTVDEAWKMAAQALKVHRSVHAIN